MKSKLIVYPVLVFEDNYSYIICDQEKKSCVVIDPGEAKPIEDFLTQKGLDLKEIWLTHHHSDHVGGALELKSKYRAIVVGPQKEREKISGLDKEVSDSDMLSFENHPYKVLEFPGHTMGHIGFWFYEDKCLFCGDTLFSLGCGFLFEGSYEEMWASLCKIRSLPEDTLIYCGHEYTEENAKFALSVDPDNEDLKKYAFKIKEKRSQHIPTIPVLLKDEMYTNPFLRADLPVWKKKLNMLDAPSYKIFQKLREKKNKFKE